MASAGSNPPQDDVSLVVALLDTNPFFWASAASSGQASSLTFPRFSEHVLAFFNSIVLLHQMNQLVVIGTGTNSCEFIYDSSAMNSEYKKSKDSKASQEILTPSTILVQQLEDFIRRDQALSTNNNAAKNIHSLLSGSLSLALCYIQRILRGGPSHPQPRILCLQGSPDGPQQYVAVMNAIFSAQRSMVPIDSCIVGSQHSAFLQQASHITGGIYLKPQQPEGLFQFLATDKLFHQTVITNVRENDGICNRFAHTQIFTATEANRSGLSCFVFLPQEDNRYGICLFCLPLDLLRTFQEVFYMRVDLQSKAFWPKAEGLRELTLLDRKVALKFVSSSGCLGGYHNFIVN